jgi:amidase
LVAFRGSILGVGTDVAGSIRIPSLCCGVYGFKPTADRVPIAGQTIYPFPRPKLPGVPVVAGPIATSVEDLTLMMTSVMEKRPWRYDVTAMDIPWRATGLDDKALLTIGVLAEDPEHPLHPPVRRALDTAATALQAAGHTVVRLPADTRHSAGLGQRIAWQFFGLVWSPGVDIAKQIGEPLVASVARGFSPFAKSPPPVSPDLDFPSYLSELTKAKEAYTDAWRELWLEHNLDVVLAPGAMSTAPPHDTYGAPAYTVMWNVADVRHASQNQRNDEHC